MQFPRLKITSLADLSIGEAKSNVVGLLVQHAYTNDSGGLTVPCDLKWWLDAASYDSSKDQVWPTVGSDKVSSISFDLTQQQFNDPFIAVTLYNSAATAIMSKYPSLTVTVELS